MEFKPLDLNSRINGFAKINADDADLEIITRRYAKHIDSEANVRLEKAKFCLDDFYKKRALKDKLQGKGS